MCSGEKNTTSMKKIKLHVFLYNKVLTKVMAFKNHF